MPALRVNNVRVVCLGMSALDTLFRVDAVPTCPAKVLASDRVECGGGMAANASVAIARLGGEAHYWGRVGDDETGTRIVGQLAAEGVDVSQVRRVPGARSPSAAILVDAHGERLVCAFNDPKLAGDGVWPPFASVNEFDAVLADVRWAEGAARLFDAARRFGVPAILDGDVGPADVLVDLAQRATHAVFSEPGLRCATGETEPSRGLRDIAARTRAWVGVTRGAQGVTWIEDGSEQTASAPAVSAVDTLAAGDVFHGAFALAIAEGAAIAHAVRFANAAAALKCTRFGGRLGAPTRNELDRFMGALS